MQTLTILGSTGSVGQSTLDVLARHTDRYRVYALTANNNVEKMLQQCEEFSPKVVLMVEPQAADALRVQLVKRGLTDIEVLCGSDALCELASDPECHSVVSAIVGAVGLMPTLSAVKGGKKVLIANKEPLVMTGDLFMREAQLSGAQILPIDSEHNAIFQCLPQSGVAHKALENDQYGVSKIHLTASGGPFRGRAWNELKDITPEQACAHPNWSMGQKISVDSATMMNKGLELIEAAALFQLPVDRVNIVIHPQSIIHSMVQYADGSFLAQLGSPDMRIPIAHALAWPDRIDSGAQVLDITEVARLDFNEPDVANLPCLRLARQAASDGQSAPAILNAANEVAVDSFLRGGIKFTQIADVIDATLQQLPSTTFVSIDDVLHINNEARRVATSALESF